MDRNVESQKNNNNNIIREREREGERKRECYSWIATMVGLTL